MNSIDPKRPDPGAEADDDRKSEDARLPTRFGRKRRLPRPLTADAQSATGEPRPALDDGGPFDDDGGL